MKNYVMLLWACVCTLLAFTACENENEGEQVFGQTVVGTWNPAPEESCELICQVPDSFQIPGVALPLPALFEAASGLLSKTLPTVLGGVSFQDNQDISITVVKTDGDKITFNSNGVMTYAMIDGAMLLKVDAEGLLKLIEQMQGLVQGGIGSDVSSLPMLEVDWSALKDLLKNPAVAAVLKAGVAVRYTLEEPYRHLRLYWTKADYDQLVPLLQMALSQIPDLPENMKKRMAVQFMITFIQNSTQLETALNLVR